MTVSGGSMRLNRSTVSAPSRIMLPTYLGIALAYGLIYLFQDPERTTAPAYAVITSILPMRGWAFMFLTLAGLKGAALLAGSRRLMVFALCVGMGVWVMWAVGFASALITDGHTFGVQPHVPLGVWIPWTAIALAHWASLRSLTTAGEQL